MKSVTYSDIFKSATDKYAKNPAIIQYVNKSYRTFSYSDLAEISNKIFDFMSDKIKSGENIAILMQHNPMIPPIINVIQECGCSFMFLNCDDDFKNTEIILQEMKINHIVSMRNDESKIDGFSRADLTCYLNEVLCLWSKIEDKFAARNANDIAYFIKTSGSTGIAKYVAVPHRCIYPNVCDFEKLFSMRPSDIVYFSTTLTFDPSIIEIYLAAKCGASLMIAPYEITAIFPQGNDSVYGITVWQTTPSKFIMLDCDIIKNIVLNDHTRLRILALGGEPIHFDFDNLKHNDNETCIYNLYGITEVSCWASVNKLNEKTFKEYCNLGENLCETLIKICNENKTQVSNTLGEIFIGSSSRKCIIDNELSQYNDKPLQNLYKHDSSTASDSIVWRNTGDLGVEINGQIYFKGRKDKLIKRYGHRVNLLEIETIAMDFNGIIQCMCFWDLKRHALILFYTSKSNLHTDFLTYLKASLNSFSVPDSIYRVDSIPINSHGKASLKKMENVYDKLIKNQVKSNDLGTIFLKLLSDYLSNQDNINGNLHKSFINLGGTSLLGTQILNRLEQMTNRSFFYLYVSILDPNLPLLNIIELLNKSDSIKHFDIHNTKSYFYNSSANISNKRLADIDSIRMKKPRLNLKYDIKTVWNFNTGKCVDANPILYEDHRDSAYIIIGSHSGKFAILNALTGKAKFEINVSSRIEAPVLCFKNCDYIDLAIFGCYDGSFWCFSILEAKLLWKNSINAMIKSRACQIESNIYIASYDSKLYTVDAQTGQIKTSIKVGIKGISADLVCWKNSIFVATIDGTCAKIVCNADSQDVAWEKMLESPIFAKPTLVKNDEHIVFTEVNKRMHCFNVLSGVTMWIFDDAQGIIFSSCSISSTNNSDTLVFGCHDRHTYKITCNENENPAMSWKMKHSSEVYSTPFINEDYVASISTDGNLQIIDMSSGQLLGEHRFPGEIFSSPVIKNNMLFVGCRDDNVYCVQIVQLR